MTCLLIVDFLNLAYRAHHAGQGTAVRGPATRRFPGGEPMWVTERLLAMTFDLIRRTSASHVAFALDADGPTFRDDIASDYKAGRPGRPVGLAVQVTRTREAIERLGFTTYEAFGFEADDVIATLVKQGEQRFDRIVVATGDRDMLATVSARTTVLDFSQGLSGAREWTPAKVFTTYGVTPAQWVDRKALIGDGGDHFLGCPGLGTRRAQALVAEHGSVAAIFRALPEMPFGEVRSLLVAGEASTRRAYRLALLRTDVPVRLDPAAGRLGEVSRDRAAAYLAPLGLGALVDRLPRGRAA